MTERSDDTGYRYEERALPEEQTATDSAVLQPVGSGAYQVLQRLPDGSENTCGQFRVVPGVPMEFTVEGNLDLRDGTRIVLIPIL